MSRDNVGRFPGPPQTLTDAGATFAQHFQEVEQFVMRLSVVAELTARERFYATATTPQVPDEDDLAIIAADEIGLQEMRRREAQRLVQERVTDYELYLGLRDIFRAPGGYAYVDGSWELRIWWPGTEGAAKAPDHQHAEVDIAALMELERWALAEEDFLDLAEEDFLDLAEAYLSKPLPRQAVFPYRMHAESSVDATLNNYMQLCAYRLMNDHRSLILETVLSHTVDNFITYLSDLFVEVLPVQSRLDMFAESQFRVGKLQELIGQSKTLEEFARALLAELTTRQLDELSRAGWNPVARFFYDQLKFLVFTTLAEHFRAAEIIAQRNVITHSRSVVDSSMLRGLEEISRKVPDQLAKAKDKSQAMSDFQEVLNSYRRKEGNHLGLDPEEVYSAVSFLAAAVHDIDMRAARQLLGRGPAGPVHSDTASEH
jgi:hypothetical protein